MPYTKTVWVNQSTPPINSTNLNKIEDGIARAQATAEAAQAAVAATGIVPLDSFTGSSDDAKLSAAMSYCAARTYKPFIGLTSRAHSFSGARGTPYSGFGLVGGGRGWLNAEQGIKHCQLTTTVSNGPWLTTTGEAGTGTSKASTSSGVELRLSSSGPLLATRCARLLSTT